jgi:hypothetical protein
VSDPSGCRGPSSLAGFVLVLVSNQSRIGRNLLTQEQAEGVHVRMIQLLAEEGGLPNATGRSKRRPGTWSNCFTCLTPYRNFPIVELLWQAQ